MKLQPVEKGAVWPKISFSLLNGSPSGECVLSQFVDALSMMPTAILHLNGEVDMVFAVVLSLLNCLSNLDKRIKLSKLSPPRPHFSLRVKNMIQFK